MEGPVSGVFYGVSVGPGDPELLTLKAVRVIENCGVIATPETSSGRTLALDIAAGAVDMSGKEIVSLPLPMTRDERQLAESHEEQAAIITSFLDAGRDVAMLNLGDATVYSTFAYIADRLKDDYEVRVVPGVTSFCASAAELGVSLTVMNRPLHIIPASGVPLDEALALPGTKVLMKSGSQLPEVITTLEERGLASKSALVQDCGLPTMRVCHDIEKDEISSSYFTTIIVKE